MNKKIKYTRNGAVLGAVALAVLNVIDQSKNQRDNQEPFDWTQLLKAIAKGGLIGGAIGLAIGALRDHFNSLEEPINTSAALLGIVDESRLSKTHPEYRRADAKARIVQSILENEFGHLLIRKPAKYGSTENGTALAGSSDIDLGLLFKPTAYRTTGDMFHDVHDCLQENKSALGNANIRLQGKSIGIEIPTSNGDFHKIDVVPCRVTNVRGNTASGYLHKRKRSLLGTQTTFTKTNIPLIKAQRLSTAQQNLVVLLKKWREEEDLTIKGNLIEVLVRKAYTHNIGRVPRRVDKKLAMVWQYIVDNLETVTIRGVENTNNILTDIPAAEKAAVIAAAKSAVEDYRYQPNSIVGTVGG